MPQSGVSASTSPRSGAAGERPDSGGVSSAAVDSVASTMGCLSGLRLVTSGGARTAGTCPPARRTAGLLSNGLSNNSSALGASDASTTQPRHAKCQVVLLLSGGL
jgi:hypothetical protein